jgi:hypothetical protein
MIEYTDILVGEIKSEWQGIDGTVPEETVQEWTTQPYKERLSTPLDYQLHIQTQLNPHVQAEIRQYRLQSGYQPDELDPGSYLQWDWILELKGADTAILTAYEWSHQFSPDGNSGHNNGTFSRPATAEDLSLFAKFLASVQKDSAEV